MLLTQVLIKQVSYAIYNSSASSLRISPVTFSCWMLAAICWSAADWFWETSFATSILLFIVYTESVIFLIIPSILSIASFEVTDNFLISTATTENPLPYSPALAASIDALRPKRLVIEISL